jgi:hypothetical protein
MCGNNFRSFEYRMDMVRVTLSSGWSAVKRRKMEETIVVFLDIIHGPVFLFKTQRFRDWILSESSGKTL